MATITHVAGWADASFNEAAAVMPRKMLPSSGITIALIRPSFNEAAEKQNQEDK
jgi:hypothetical protein